MAKITVIEGIGEEFAQKLQMAGITTTEALLEHGASRWGREEIAEETGISVVLIQTWVNHADLLRIKGIGEEYADLLESAGVDSVAKLARRRAENLVLKITELNESKKLVRRLPGQSQVTDWIEQARALPRPGESSDMLVFGNSLAGDGGIDNIP